MVVFLQIFSETKHRSPSSIAFVIVIYHPLSLSSIIIYHHPSSSQCTPQKATLMEDNVRSQFNCPFTKKCIIFISFFLRSFFYRKELQFAARSHFQHLVVLKYHPSSSIVIIHCQQSSSIIIVHCLVHRRYQFVIVYIKY